MASITIRNLDEDTKAKLRIQAAHHKRSMEDEARKILHAALQDEPLMQRNLADSIQRRFKTFGGVNIQLPGRELLRRSRR